MTTWSGIAGLGLGHPPGREHDSTPLLSPLPPPGVEWKLGAISVVAKENGASPDLIAVLLCCCVVGVVVVEQ